jgi:glycosyltransferase involved in cell wall biosynthesis
VGRLVPEKNLEFLASAVADLLSTNERAHFLVVGRGPLREEIEHVFHERQLLPRLHLTGPLAGERLVEAYHAMDVFAFTSRSETQGMVLAEAMTAGVPVVALDAPGSRDIVEHQNNGLLVPCPAQATFAEALRTIAALDDRQRREYAAVARRTAHRFSLTLCTRELLGLYERARARQPTTRQPENGWAKAVGRLEAEWRIWRSRAAAAVNSASEWL